MATIETIVADIQSTITAVSGIKKAPALPPEQIPPDMFPFVIAFPDTGTISAHTNTDAVILCSVVVELHVSRKDLAFDTDKIYPYFEDIPEALYADTTFGGTADTFGNISWEFGELNWGEVPTIGIRFTINDLKYKITW